MAEKMKRRTFIKKGGLAGAAIAAAPISSGLSLAEGLSNAKPSIPAVHFTQQDFVSTFPWGIRGDKVRIIEQELENGLLDAETLAAMAFMLGGQSASERLDEAWKLLLDSQNHDIHVCLQDEVGIDWCKTAKAMAAEVRQEASEFIGGRVGGPAVALNTLSWTRPAATGPGDVPAFGYAAADSGQVFDAATQEDKSTVWSDWFTADTYNLRLREDGSWKQELALTARAWQFCAISLCTPLARTSIRVRQNCRKPRHG